MSEAIPFVERCRGDFLECVHRGQAVVVNGSGEMVHEWGNAHSTILPRSSCKMIQALPLIESGAAKAHGLNSEQLALACASHNGAAIHTDRVTRWLGDLGMSESDLRCGPQMPDDLEARVRMNKTDEKPCQIHNNCSGKHAGFLTLNKHLDGSAEYIDPDHPVQKASLAALEETSGVESVGYGIDGCSAPNFATTLYGLAKAMAFFANAKGGSNTRETAAVTLREAMMKHPDLVAGEGRACTGIMRELNGTGTVKTGAEGVFTAILPDLGLGVALKIEDGTTIAAQCAIVAILVKLGALEANAPSANKWMTPIVRSRLGLEAGAIKPAAALL